MKRRERKALQPQETLAKFADTGKRRHEKKLASEQRPADFKREKREEKEKRWRAREKRKNTCE